MSNLAHIGDNIAFFGFASSSARHSKIKFVNKFISHLAGLDLCQRILKDFLIGCYSARDKNRCTLIHLQLKLSKHII